jgi:hypothetical protein
LSISWTDSDDESEGEITNKVTAFTGKYETSSDTSDEDLTVEEMVEAYRLLLTKWKETCILGEKNRRKP